MPKIKPYTLWMVDGTKITEDQGTLLDLDNGIFTISTIEVVDRPIQRKNWRAKSVPTGKTAPVKVKVPIKSYPISRIKEIDWGYCSPALFKKLQEELAKEKAKQDNKVTAQELAKAKEDYRNNPCPETREVLDHLKERVHGKNMPNNVDGGRQ